MTLDKNTFTKGTKLTSNDPVEMLKYCVLAIEYFNLNKEEMNTHQQWATKLFSNLDMGNRKLMVSKVKQACNIYIIKQGLKWRFDFEKIENDYPEWFGGLPKKNNLDPLEAIYEALKIEEREARNPHNIEEYKVTDVELQKRVINKYFIYEAKLEMKDGANPHFREGLQFELKAKGRYKCETVDFDTELGLLYFTCPEEVHLKEKYNTITLDASFIINAAINRLHNFAALKKDDTKPVYKFLEGRTNELKPIKHPVIPSGISKKLDYPQEEAFNAALDNDITFIWGPPGTGKSYTLAAIIRALYSIKEERTAVCCISNVAVDQLLNKVVDIINDEGLIMKPGRMYRAGHSIDNRILATDYLFPDDEITKHLRIKIEEKLKDIKKNIDTYELFYTRRQLKEKMVSLKAEIKDLRNSLQEHTDYLVQNSNIVFSTISNFILSERINKSEFDNLIVDEASMLSIAHLVAMAGRVNKRIIVVGDFQQLSPIAYGISDWTKNNVFAQSHIDIEHTDHPALHLLLNQRRSHSKIVSIINDIIYKNKLKAKITEENDLIKVTPFEGRVIAYKRVFDGKVRFVKGGSRQNKRNAEIIIEMLDSMQDADFSIGIISPYKGQTNMLRAMIAERNYQKEFANRIKVGTIHTFQGSECDLIIFDIVETATLESGAKASVGKLYYGKEGEQLLNVALSRAQHKLIIVGDAEFFETSPGENVTTTTLKFFKKIKSYKV